MPADQPYEVAELADQAVAVRLEEQDDLPVRKAARAIAASG